MIINSELLVGSWRSKIRCKTLKTFFKKIHSWSMWTVPRWSCINWPVLIQPLEMVVSLKGR